MVRRRVAAIFGGRSGEHEVSILSARSVMQALDTDRWDVVPFGITRSGAWLTPAQTRQALAAGQRAFVGGGASFLSSSEALAALATCEVAFPLVHGTYGEDGCLQGFLEMAAMPYTGAGVAASAIGMDKALMKALFREAGIRTPRYAVVRSWELTAGGVQAQEYIESTLGYPCFVKPANGGSSVGVTKVRSREDLPGAFNAAFAYDDKAVVEEAISGQEVECSVLGNEAPEVSIPGEIVPDREFYDYDSKYDPRSRTAHNIPANIPQETADQVRELALRMYTVMGCEGYARVDFFVRNVTEVIANEVNTIPGFTSISMYPKLWEATGVSYRDLLTRILELALERHQRRARP
ncbi:MAG: D-alanine--D-alanine ligase [Chloroflexi bacterium]|nr:D-alanine--D-alanine ligase [Chloroflexota bacterium]